MLPRVIFLLETIVRLEGHISHITYKGHLAFSYYQRIIIITYVNIITIIINAWSLYLITWILNALTVATFLILIFVVYLILFNSYFTGFKVYNIWFSFKWVSIAKNTHTGPTLLKYVCSEIRIRIFILHTTDMPISLYLS